MKTIISILLYFLIANAAFAQNFTAGNAYLDTTGYVKYIAGNLPIILSVPHGGYLEPADIPDRDCAGCSYIRDAYTQELANEIKDAFFQQTGCYPHIIINLLHRKKFDANRDIGEAADGNPTVETSWYNYHAFIDSAKQHIAKNYARGLFLDLHGHGHTIQRIELGYLLTKTELQLANTVLNGATYVNLSSIRLLESDNLQSLTHAELLRGDLSFGTLLDQKGYPTVPSTADPAPLSADPYFSGGYNTARYGSVNADTLDAIQIERNSSIRFDATQRVIFADSLTRSILQYIDFHYLDNFEGNYCNLITTNTQRTIFPSKDMILYPNPTCQEILIDNHEFHDGEIAVLNAQGQLLLQQNIRHGVNKINIHHLPNGLYFIQMWDNGKIVAVDKIVKVCD